MPELPEVETTRRGVAPHITDQTVRDVHVRNPRLRWRVSSRLAGIVRDKTIRSVERRGKYILLVTDAGSVIVHLGMSGSLRVMPAGAAPGPYDHVEFEFANGMSLCLRDPRRFGCVMWCADPSRHRLLRFLGPEPLSDEFNGEYLYATARARRLAVKNLIMNARVVCGVGNIYASEALFAANIHPARGANRISRVRYDRLAAEIKHTLGSAIAAGGTTLRDFTRADGNPGYFRVQLAVYGREGQPCVVCRAPIRRRALGQRSSFFCPHCQR